MHDDLTAQDIEMMQKELDHRKLELMPELIEEVKRTRAFGDLSENFEYKAAKQAQNRNRSRIRYLERMIKSAHVIEDKAGADEVGLFDKVELLFEDDDDTDTIQVVTTVRCDPLNGRISCKAPLGKAVLGKKVGDRVDVTTEEGDSYTVVIKSITKEKMMARDLFCNGKWRMENECAHRRRGLNNRAMHDTFILHPQFSISIIQHEK